MAQSFTITLGNTLGPQVIDALAWRKNWTAQIPNPAWNPLSPADPVTNPQTIPNPQTKKQAALERLKDLIREDVRAYTETLDVTAAQVGARTKIDQAFIDTFTVT